MQFVPYCFGIKLIVISDIQPGSVHADRKQILETYSTGTLVPAVGPKFVPTPFSLTLVFISQAFFPRQYAISLETFDTSYIWND